MKHCTHELELWPPTQPFPVTPGKLIPYCFICWRAGVAVGIKVKSPEKESSQRSKCFHLGIRTEFKNGCSGWMCGHKCDIGEPIAIPGGVCQTCSKWESQ